MGKGSLRAARAAWALSFALSAACAAPRAAHPTLYDWPREARLVDLSHPFDAHTLYWPSETTHFALEPRHDGPTEDGFYYRASAFCTPEHGGTHVDAPSHFAEGGASVEAIPLERLVGDAVVIDVRDRVARDVDYRLTRDDVLQFETTHGRVPDGAIVLVLTGHATRWDDRAAYFGTAEPNDVAHLHFPGFSVEAATLLVDERHAAALGLDGPSLDHGPSTDFPVHRFLAARGVPGFENLMQLEALGPVGSIVVALPMKIAGGSGAPLRAIAIVPPP